MDFSLSDILQKLLRDSTNKATVQNHHKLSLLLFCAFSVLHQLLLHALSPQSKCAVIITAYFLMNMELNDNPQQYKLFNCILLMHSELVANA